ncbi:MAG: Ig-like domain-containing protein, partial [Sandarakinorhabdus sp.]
MTTTRFQLSTGSFQQDWSDAGLITASDDWSGVPSIMGYLGELSGTTNDRDPRLQVAATQLGPVDVIHNSSATNGTTGGVYELDGIANRTIAFVGSGTADAPNIVIFLDATGRKDIRFQANIRDLDPSADNAAQQLVVQWRTGEGTWNNVFYDADVTTQSTATEVTAVDVTLPADANNSATLEIRVMTTNSTGSDETIGIDDIIVSSTAISGPPPADTTAPTLAVVNPADPDDGATAVAVDSNIVLRFSEDIVAGTGSFTLSNGTDVRTIAVGDAQVSISGNTLTINPTTDLVGGTTYALTAGSGIVKDAANNNFAGIAAGVLDFATLAPLVNRTIGEIQGLSHTSAFVGQVVLTQGVVTAVDSNGYYIQSAVGATDADVRTSDGIFVFTNSAPGVTVTVGRLLEVTGTVAEFRPGGNPDNLTGTQLTSATWTNLGTATVETTTIGTGGRLPPTQIIDNDSFGTYDPSQDGIDFWESLEAMLVTLDTPIAISNTNNFGETYVAVSGGTGSTGQAASGGLTIAANDFNPERIQLDNDNGLFAGFDNIFSIGDRLSSVTGIVSYNFQSYEVLVTQAVTTTDDVTATKQITNLAETGAKLSVASYNVENLAANSSPTKIASLASDIVTSLKSPDIIGVQEIQDANGASSGGSLSGQATADALIAAIVLAGGPTYQYVEIAPTTANTTGGEPNGNIRNGYLYDPSRVTYVNGSAQVIEGAAFNNS